MIHSLFHGAEIKKKKVMQRNCIFQLSVCLCKKPEERVENVGVIACVSVASLLLVCLCMPLCARREVEVA